MDIDLSSSSHVLQARTLPYPQRGQLGRDYGSLGTDPVDFPLDYRGSNRPPSSSDLPLYSRQGDPLSWVAAPDAPWTAVKPLGNDALPSNLWDGTLRIRSTENKNDNVITPKVVPSDSGYETRQSISNTSVFSGDMYDIDIETSSSIAYSVLLEHQQHALSSSLFSAPRRKNTTANGRTRKALARQHPSLACSTCGMIVKTRSELKCVSHQYLKHLG